MRNRNQTHNQTEHFIIDAADVFLTTDNHPPSIELTAINPTAVTFINNHPTTTVLFNPTPYQATSFVKIINHRQSTPASIAQAIRELSKALPEQVQYCYFRPHARRMSPFSPLHPRTQTDPEKNPEHYTAISSNPLMRQFFSTLRISHRTLPAQGSIPTASQLKLARRIQAHLSQSHRSKVTLMIDIDNTALNNQRSNQAERTVLNSDLISTLNLILATTRDLSTERLTLYLYTARLHHNYTAANGTSYFCPQPSDYDSEHNVLQHLSRRLPYSRPIKGVIFSEFYRYRMHKGHFLNTPPPLHPNYQHEYPNHYKTLIRRAKERTQGPTQMIILIDDNAQEGRNFVEILNQHSSATCIHKAVCPESDFSQIKTPMPPVPHPKAPRLAITPELFRQPQSSNPQSTPTYKSTRHTFT